MKNRRSIRNYTEKPVTKETIGRIISAAYFAPTAARIQGYQIIVV
ncbi:MAG: nitroreductase family protein, partial [Candidatus Hodarchaeota archaeon]